MTTYQTAKQLSENHDLSLSSVRTLIKEIRQQVDAGRYPDGSVLTGCNVLVNIYVFYDYLNRRRALKDSVACRFVPEFDVEQWKELCGREDA